LFRINDTVNKLISFSLYTLAFNVSLSVFAHHKCWRCN